jgi:predicted MFS family arabinose efflux permease
VKVAVESMAGTLLLFVLPATLSLTFGPRGVVYGMVAFILLLTPLLLALPRVWQKDAAAAQTGHGAAAGPLDRVAIFTSVLSLLMVFAGISAIWAFAERMGKISGYDPAAVGQLLAFTLFSGIFASLAVAWWGDALNAVRSYVCALGIVILALLLLSVPGSFAVYALGNCLYMIGWSAATPLASAEIARLDTDGRYTALIVPAVGLGSMIGPAVAGGLLQYFGTSALFAFVAVAIVLAAGLMLYAARRAPLQPPAALAGVAA